MLIGVTDNKNFEENCQEDVNNIYVLNLINGDKISTQNKIDNFMEIKWAKEDNICVFIMIKDKKLFFKVNDEYN